MLGQCSAQDRYIDENVAGKAVPFGGFYVLGPVVDKHSFAIRQTKAAQGQLVDCRIRLDELFIAGDQNFAKGCEEGSFARDERFPECTREVGNRKTRHLGCREFGNHVCHAGNQVRNGFVEAGSTGPDQRTAVWKLSTELGARFGKWPPGIMLEMPCMRHNIAQKNCTLVRTGIELVVKMARIPFDQHLADTEDDRPYGHRAGLALTCLEAAVRLVDDVSPPTTANHPIVPMAILERLE